MANAKDIIAIQKILAGALPAAKFDERTVAAWATAFRSVPRLKLWLVASEYIMQPPHQYTPSVSEFNDAVRKWTVNNSYWRNPQEPQDERCLWYMALNGIEDPYSLTDKQVTEIYA